MEQIAKTLSEFKKLDKIEIEQVLLQLLIDGDLQFQDIVVSYVHYLVIGLKNLIKPLTFGHV